MTINSTPTSVVQTPQLAAGHYVVAAEVVAGGATDTGDTNNRMTCWVTADSAGLSNGDDVQATSSSFSSPLELAVDDIITTTSANNRVYLACDNGNQDSGPIQATNASITVTQAQAIETKTVGANP